MRAAHAVHDHASIVAAADDIGHGKYDSLAITVSAAA